MPKKNGVPIQIIESNIEYRRNRREFDQAREYLSKVLEENPDRALVPRVKIRHYELVGGGAQVIAIFLDRYGIADALRLFTEFLAFRC